MRSVVAEQFAKARDELDTKNPCESAHAVRKRLKKLRAVLRLFRDSIDSYSRFNRMLRDLGRTLAPLREARALQETVERLKTENASPHLDAVLTELKAREERVVKNADFDASKLAAALSSTEAQIVECSLDADDFAALRGGLARTHRRARTLRTVVQKSWDPVDIHQWRKRCKYHRYHMQLLAPAWPALIEAREAELHRLTDLLGAHHDLEDLLNFLSRRSHLSESGLALAHLVRQKQLNLAKDALALGTRSFAESTKCFVAHIEGVWQGWAFSELTAEKL